MSVIDFMNPNLGMARPAFTTLLGRGPRPADAMGAPRLPRMLGGLAVEARKDLACLAMVGSMAVLSLDGYLSYEASWSWPGCFTADRDLVAAVRHCRENAAVAGVLLDTHSAGGSSFGTSDLMNEVRLLAAEKPVRAIAHDLAASKAYMVAGLAPRLACTPTAMVGSVGATLGVVFDASEHLRTDGVVAHDLATGTAKNFGVYGLPVSPEEVASVRAMASRLLDPILAMLAAPRRMDPEAFLALQARTFAGADAVAAGLVDEVAAFDDLAADFLAELQGGGRVTSIAPTPIPTTTPTPSVAPDTEDPDEEGDPELFALRHAPPRTPPHTPPHTQGVRMSTASPTTGHTAPAATPKASEARPLTLEGLKASNPELVTQLGAELRTAITAELAAPKPATFDELHAAFGQDEPAFVTTAMAAKMTLVQAHAEHAKMLRTRLAELGKEAEGHKKKPTLSVAQPLAPTIPATPGAKPATLNAAIAEIQKARNVDYCAAFAIAGKEHPDLYEAAGAVAAKA